MDKPVDTSTVDINNFLIRRLGEREASEVMAYINAEVEREVSVKSDTVKKEIITWREEMNKVFATREAYEKMQSKLTRRISGVESTLILWAIVFWITQILAVYCIIKFVR